MASSRARATDRLRRAAGSVALTGRGVGFLVAAALVFVLAPILSLPALLYATALLLGMVVFAGLFAVVGLSKVHLSRSFTPDVVGIGDSSRVGVSITNLSVLPCVEARWEDTLPTSLTGSARGTMPALGGRSSGAAEASFEYVVQGRRRGSHLVGPLDVKVVDPFGLVSRRHTFGVKEPIIVLPQIVELPPVAARGVDADGATRPAPQHVGMGEDDVIARAYVPGDAMKQLHWKATAHRGELMVRQEEQQVNPRAVVHLDCDARSLGVSRDHRGEWEHSPWLEWGVVAAASMAVHLVNAGYVVAVQSSSRTVSRVVADHLDSIEDALIDLAVVEPATTDHEHDDVGERAAFVVLGRTEPERAHRWVSALSGTRSVHAFVAHGTSAEALDVLDDAGWRCVEYRPTDDLREAWSTTDGARSDVH